MNKKIFSSSFLATTLVLASAIILIVGVMFNLLERRTEQEIAHEAEYLARAVEYSDEGFLDMFSDSSDKRVTLIAKDGTVIFDNRADAKELENHAERQEIKEAMEEGTGMSVRYSKTLTGKTLYYAIRLTDGRILRVAVEQYTVLTVLFGMIQPIGIILLVGFLLTLVLSARVSRSIVKPINELDLEHPECNDTYEELAPLLKRLAAQRDKINKQEMMRSEFTANVSHELKTPLTSISGFAELMKDGGVPEELSTDFSKSIYDEAQRLITLVNDIIKISELDEKNITLDEEEVDLYELASNIKERLQAEANKKNITVNLIGHSATVTGVRKILDEMISNLCDNAIKYNKEKGLVDIIINENAEEVRLAVCDTGIGIPKSHQKRVFERFYRVDKSHSKQVGGTGLGLAIVKHGAIYHNVKIELESTDGIGTSVVLVFKKTEQKVEG